MKRVLSILCALSIITMFLVTPVAAATSQGLEWGVQTGSEFDFTLTISGTSEMTEDMFMNITDMPAAAIPDPLTSWGAIPEPDIGAYWANGTDIGLYALLFIGLLALGSRMVVPVGNFTLLSDLIAVELTGEDIKETSTTWGIEWSVDKNATHEYKYSAYYSKTDGFLTDYRMELLESASSNVVESVAFTRKGLPGGFDLNLPPIIQDNLLYIGIGVGVLVILAVVCRKR